MSSSIPMPRQTRRRGFQEKIGVAPGYFLWLSNFYPYKQGDRLLAGYARLDPETRRRHPLVMVGGEWEGHLQACRNRRSRRHRGGREIHGLGGG